MRCKLTAPPVAVLHEKRSLPVPGTSRQSSFYDVSLRSTKPSQSAAFRFWLVVLRKVARLAARSRVSLARMPEPDTFEAGVCHAV